MRYVAMAALVITVLIGFLAFWPRTAMTENLAYPLFFIGIVVTLFLMVSRRNLA